MVEEAPQFELVVPDVAVTDADAPVPPPKLATNEIPPAPVVDHGGPVKLVMLGRLTVTVAGAEAETPA